jgi:pantetheine-phosphate adenylyltransferase
MTAKTTTTATRRKIRSSKRIGVYPGAFDPLTNGHISLIERAARIFDEVIVGIAENIDKRGLFTAAERQALASKSLSKFDNVSVERISGLTAHYALKANACAIIRGIRAISDFDYEFQMALMNRKLERDIETVFLMPSLSWVYLSSTMVKDVARNGGDVATLVPAVVNRALKKKFSELSNSARQ